MLHVPGGPWYPSELSSVSRTENFAATGTTATPRELTGSQPSFTLQVVGVGAAATVWDVRLEGSLDGVSWFTILTHTTVNGNGAHLFTGANRYGLRLVRVNVNGLTLGAATSINVLWRASH